jgi:hypothetical protein
MTAEARFNLRYAAYVRDVPQRDVHGLTTCSWDHVELKRSSENGPDVQRFVKETGISVPLHLQFVQ